MHLKGEQKHTTLNNKMEIDINCTWCVT